MTDYTLDAYDYRLPDGAIAQRPVEPRDASRLLVLGRQAGAVSHRHFYELPELLDAGDLLVINRTQVIPARLRLVRPTGGKCELLLFRPVDGPVPTARTWDALGRPAKALKPGTTLHTHPEGAPLLEVVGRTGDAVRVQSTRGPLLEVLEQHGELPLPPYIERPGGPQTRDAQDYQTVFARERGAVAAPTASLHFTGEVMRKLEGAGVGVAELVLHVGPGTFLPVRPEHRDDIRRHPMHAEHYRIPPETRERIEQTRRAGGRIVAVGTTVVRTLESWADCGEPEGESDLFIYPGFEFRLTDAMVTNFHLPRSTLLMLVSAFAGRERVLAAYEEAIREGYRFYSYGDAMLIR